MDTGLLIILIIFILGLIYALMRRMIPRTIILNTNPLILIYIDNLNRNSSPNRPMIIT